MFRSKIGSVAIAALMVGVSPADAKTRIGQAGAAEFALHDDAAARKIVDLVEVIRAAARRCDSSAHYWAVEALRKYLAETEASMLSPDRPNTHRLDPDAEETGALDEALTEIAKLMVGVDPSAPTLPKAKEDRKNDAEDAATLKEFRTYYFNASEIRFPEPCPPRQAGAATGNDHARLWVGLQGGPLFTAAGDRRLTGTDDFDPLNPDVDRRNFSSDVGGLIGGTVTFYPPVFEEAPFDLFLRTGLLANIGGGTREHVDGVNAFAQGTGIVRDKLRWTIPLLLGVELPLGGGGDGTGAGAGSSGFFVQVFGGARIAGRKSSLSLTENGAGPGGLPVEASRSQTSVDPVVGAEVQRQIGELVRVGFGASFSFPDTQTLTAQSPNFASQVYRIETGRKVDMAFLVSFSVPLR